MHYFVSLVITLFSIWSSAYGNDDDHPLLTLKNISNSSGSSKEACIYQCADQEAFDECMTNCYGTWIFGNRDLLNSCDDISPIADITDGVACTPRNIEALFEFTKMLPSHEVVGFLYMKWKPCQSGIVDLRGYYVHIVNFEISQSCYGIPLIRNLTTSENDRKMDIDLVFRIDNNAQYAVGLQAYPFHDHDDSYYSFFTTRSCEELNGPNSCFCGRVPPPSPTVTVTGYSLNVSFYPVKPCFNVFKYDIQLLCTRPVCEHPPPGYTVTINKGDRSLITHQFQDVYDSDIYSFGVKVVALYDLPRTSDTTKFEVKAWLPPKPKIVSLENDTGLVEVSFVLSPDYNISLFEMRLIKYFQENTTNSTLSSDTIKATKARQGVVTKQYYLDNGLYGIQVREVRSKSAYYNSAQWGLVQAFRIHREQNGREWNIVVVASVTVGAVLLFLFIFACYCIRRGIIPDSCTIIRKLILPFLPPEPLPELRRLNIFLVWQSDYRSNELRRLQENVIKCLVSFLSTLGIELTVDLYEQGQLSEQYGSWMDKAIANADKIVFVCPHFKYAMDKQHLVGNFNRAYRYLVNQGVESKFVTVVFPHANPDVSSDAVYLRRISAMFLLMDNIDGFYFHLQGLSKTNFIQTLSVEHMNGRDYVKIPEGKDLENALKELKAELDRFAAQGGDVIQHNSGDDGSNGDGCSSSHYEESNSLLHGNEINPLLQPESFHFPTDLTTCCPPDTNSFPLKPRRKCEPIAPFVNDTDRAILELNGHSNFEAYSCPIHNDLPDSDKSFCEHHCRVFYSHEASYLHAHVFGEECGACDDATNPKSPMESEQDSSIRNNSMSDRPESCDDSGIYPTCSDDSDKISIV